MKESIMKKNLVPVLSGDEKIDALNYVLDILESFIEYDLPEGIEITEVRLFGSRINGNCREDSDLDVFVGYKNIGDEYHKESQIFNILNGEDLYYNGIKIDFFPTLQD